MVHRHVYLRGNRYIYRRRIPSEVAHLDPRREVKLALKTADLVEASRKADIYDRQMEKFWSALALSGNSADLEKQYAAAVQLARAHGFAYKTADEIAREPLDQILARIDQADGRERAVALLGGIDVPRVMLSAVNEEYWDLAADRVQDKDSHEYKKWKNPRFAAMKNFIAEIGDKAIGDLTRTDTLAFREWLNEKILDGFAPNSTNKQMRAVKMMIRTVALVKQVDIDVDALFKDISFSEPENSREPFEAEYVEKILLHGLDELLEDARFAFYALAGTGARPSEIVRALPEDIRLDAEIPFLWIRQKTKTRTSGRQIPLVGVALYAFQQRPQGFNERWKNADSLSNLVNRYLREKNLLPTEKHSLYSLRHTFKDRLRDIEAPEEIIDDLMGHKKSGPKYGRGHRLETKLKWLEKIAYKYPVK